MSNTPASTPTTSEAYQRWPWLKGWEDTLAGIQKRWHQSYPASNGYTKSPALEVGIQETGREGQQNASRDPKGARSPQVDL